MRMDQKHQIHWGGVCAYACLFAYIVMIGVAVRFHWHWLDLTYLIAGLAALGVGSVVVLWRGWHDRGKPGGVRLDQLSALPRSWQKWVLGETDDRASK